MAFSADCCASKQRSSRRTSGSAPCARASARLLRARRSHSSDRVGSRRSGGINLAAFANGRTDDRADAILEALDVLGGPDKDVDRDVDVRRVGVDFLSEGAAMLDVGLDDEEVDVGLGPYVAGRGGPEEEVASG